MLRRVEFVLLCLALAGCGELVDRGEAPGADIVWDVDSDGRMELLAQDGLWRFDPELAEFSEVGEYPAFHRMEYELDRSRGPRLGGASGILLGRDDACAADPATGWGGVGALAADGTSECVLGDLHAPYEPTEGVAVLVVQQANGMECLIRIPVSKPLPESEPLLEIGCPTGAPTVWPGWSPLPLPNPLTQLWWRPCGGVVRPAGEVGMLICAGVDLVGWASASVDGGELDYVEFSTAVDAGDIHAEDPRFPNHFGIGAGNSVGKPPDVPTRLCTVSDWDAGDISCALIDATDPISSLQLMRLDPEDPTPAVLIRSEFGERQWIYVDGERRELTVTWPEGEDSPYHAFGYVTVLDANGDGVDELAVRSATENLAPALLEFDGDAGLVPVAPL